MMCIYYWNYNFCILLIYFMYYYGFYLLIDLLIYFIFGCYCFKPTLGAESHRFVYSACNSSVSPAGGDIVIQINSTIV